MTSKGQVTIPARVRQALGLDSGDRIEFVEIAKNQFAILPATGSVRELRGLLRERPKKPVSIEDMNRGGTATAITSIYSGTHLAEHPKAARLARECNEYAAKMMQDYPGRFGMFASLPALDVDATAQHVVSQPPPPARPPRARDRARS